MPTALALLRSAAAGLALLAGLASAQDFPNRPIRIVVPFPPGGPTDVSTRLIAVEMQRVLGQTVLVDNKPGAAGALGVDAVAKSPPDGYTLGISGVGPTILLAALDPKLPYKPLKDLAFVGHTGAGELFFVARQGLPVATLPELLSLAKAKPGGLSYASAGSGGPVNVSFELLKGMAGIELLHVPYKGDPPALSDLLGGQVDLGLLSSTAALSHVKGGRLKALAAAGATRSKIFPDLPTAAESGLPGYEAGVWTLLVAPAGTPAPAIARLNAALAAALRSPGLRNKYEQMGIVPQPMSPEQTLAFVSRESAKWIKVIQDAKVTRE